jgi:hypothetical protein
VFAGAGIIIAGLLWNLRNEAKGAPAIAAPAIALPQTGSS